MKPVNLQNVNEILSFFVVVLLHFVHAYYEGLQDTCPLRFEQSTDATVFDDYCQAYFITLARVPGELGQEVCYSKCLESETCWSYYYETELNRCHVCLRKMERFQPNGLPSNLVRSVDIPPAGVAFQARIGK